MSSMCFFALLHLTIKKNILFNQNMLIFFMMFSNFRHSRWQTIFLKFHHRFKLDRRENFFFFATQFCFTHVSHASINNTSVFAEFAIFVYRKKKNWTHSVVDVWRFSFFFVVIKIRVSLFFFAIKNSVLRFFAIIKKCVSSFVAVIKK